MHTVSEIYKTLCCSLKFIGKNHSPKDPDLKLCRNCGAGWIGFNKVRKKKAYRNYEHLFMLPLSEMIGRIGEKKRCPKYNVNLNSLRLMTFRTGVICKFCGIKGTHWGVDKNGNDTNPHLNLWNINEDGELTLMTCDHVIPKSRGGKDDISNVQTLCDPCNGKKGSKLI